MLRLNTKINATDIFINGRCSFYQPNDSTLLQTVGISFIFLQPALYSQTLHTHQTNYKLFKLTRDLIYISFCWKFLKCYHHFNDKLYLFRRNLDYAALLSMCSHYKILYSYTIVIATARIVPTLVRVWIRVVVLQHPNDQIYNINLHQVFQFNMYFSAPQKLRIHISSSVVRVIEESEVSF